MIDLNPNCNESIYLSINGYDSGLATINFGNPQRSVLGPLVRFTTLLMTLIYYLCLGNSIKKWTN